ncbi:opine dehydrogenase-like [Gigantopelta aegis]|uniref:opine dehydrogenase-like n=1 Tax=Gigantopelta aegis TaxID=1735272 RepID=UPI001B88A2B6|nr:opine dehydrogenase-like [Gigantopelta aegis]
MSNVVVLVCGGANVAHVVAGLAASRENIEARVLVLKEDEAEQWRKNLKDGDFVVQTTDVEGDPVEIKAKPRTVSKDPKRVVPGANVIILTMPWPDNNTYLEAISPHVDNNSIIVGITGQPGFEFGCLDILKSKANKCTIVAFSDIPWACRIVEFGKKVKVLANKISVDVSVINGKSKPAHKPVELLQKIVGPQHEVEPRKNYLEPYLTNMSVIHPTLMYGKWKDWDGKPLDKKPPFYKEIGDKSAKLLQSIADEMFEIVKVMSENPKLDMWHVLHLYDWFLNEYADNISDTSSLLTCLSTNSAFDGVCHPMNIAEDGTFVPNFQYRYLVEDVPNGLVMAKGLALIAKVKTPVVDEVLLWCQDKMGKEYLKDGKLTGKDIKETGCPQRCGFKTVEDLVNVMF